MQAGQLEHVQIHLAHAHTPEQLAGGPCTAGTRTQSFVGRRFLAQRLRDRGYRPDADMVDELMAYRAFSLWVQATWAWLTLVTWICIASHHTDAAAITQRAVPIMPAAA